MGPASMSILAAVCCVCALLSLLIAYLVWAMITIVYSVDSANSECGVEFNLWVFCLTVVIIVPILGCVASCITYYTVGAIQKLSTHMQNFPCCLGACVFVCVYKCVSEIYYLVQRWSSTYSQQLNKASPIVCTHALIIISLPHAMMCAAAAAAEIHVPYKKSSVFAC
jgi:hypothetical protein